MSDPAPIASHERAGRVLPVRLAVRLADASAAAGTASAALTGEAPLAPGRTRCGALEVSLELTADGPRARIGVRVRNTANQPLRLQSVALGLRWCGHGLDSLRFLRHGWQSWSFTGARELDAAGEPAFPSGAWLRGLHHALGERPADRAGWHESELVTLVGGSPGGPACCLGALERGESFGIVYLRREADAVALELELRVDALLEPGAERGLEPVRVELGDASARLLESFAEEHGRSAAARVARPFVSGWCSWYHFFGGVREEDVLRNLDALAAARDELPVEVVQLDDGFQRAVGDWLDTNDKFPSGLAALADAIRSAGFVAGLWTAPFCAVPGSQLARRHPEWLLRGPDGPALALLHPEWSPDARVFALDASRDDVLDHLETLYRELVVRGFQHLKLDFLHAACLEAAPADPGVARAARLRRGLEAVRRGAGEEAFLLGCGSPLGPAVGIVDAMRIGPDVAPRWDVDPARAIPGLEATLPAAGNAVRNAFARVFMHRRLWLNDPDCLVVREDSQLAAHEARSLAAALASSGGVLLLSDDVPGLSSGRRALAAETLAVAREVDGLGIPGRARVADPLDLEPPVALVAADADIALAVLQNPGDAPLQGRLELGAVDAPPRVLFGSRVPALADGSLAALLEPRESVAVRARRPAQLVVFCDFDGTFSVQDVGSTLAQRHAGARRPAVWARYERGEISAWEYNLEILGGLALSWSAVDAFLHTVDLDPGARELLDWCESHGVPFRVLSDGFDANLNRLQQIHGVRFAYDANFLRFDAGVWRIRAAFPNPECGCGTGICKRGRIEAWRRERPGATLVHVGNGRVSDLCGALAADVAFAKDSLAEELTRRGHAFERFDSLHDVIPRLAALCAAPPVVRS